MGRGAYQKGSEGSDTHGGHREGRSHLTADSYAWRRDGPRADATVRVPGA